MHPGFSRPLQLKDGEGADNVPLLPAVVPHPPATAPDKRAPSSPMWTNQNSRKANVNTSQSARGGTSSQSQRPGTQQRSTLTPRGTSRGTMGSTFSGTTSSMPPLHGLSNWPSAQRRSRGAGKDGSEAAVKPPLVHELDSYIRRELFHLGKDSHSVFDRIPIVSEAFNTLLCHFSEYKELLSSIKREYDLAVGEGLAAVQEVHKLRTDVASQKQFYTYMMDSEKTEVEAQMRQVDLKMKQHEEKMKSAELNRNAEACKRIEADLVNEKLVQENEDLTSRCKLLSDTLLNENMRQSLLVQQGKKLKSDNERLQRVCQALENRIQNEPLMSDAAPAQQVVSPQPTQQQPSSEAPGITKGAASARAMSLMKTLADDVKKTIQIGQHNKTQPGPPSDIEEVRMVQLQRIARLQQMIIQEREESSRLRENIERLEKQREEEHQRTRHVLQLREKLEKERDVRRKEDRERAEREAVEYQDRITDWVSSMKDIVEKSMQEAAAGGLQEKKKKKAAKGKGKGKKDAKDAHAPPPAEEERTPFTDINRQLADLMIIAKLPDNVVKPKDDDKDIDKRVGEQVPWTPRPEWLQLENVLPNFRLESEDISSRDVLEKVKATIQDELNDMQVRAMSENMRKWIGKENLTDEEVGGMSNKSFIGHGTGPHVPIFLRYQGLVRNKSITKGSVEDLLKEFWAKRKAELRVEGHLEIQSIQDFYFGWLKAKCGNEMEAITLAYNMMDVCEASKSDPDCGMFLSIMYGRVSEATFHDQLSIVDRLLFLMNHRDKKAKENQHMERSGYVHKEGYLHRVSFNRVLRKFFPAKSMDDMLKLRFSIIPFTDEDGFVDYNRLFEEDDDGNQTRFVELLREQHLWEINEFVVDVEEAIRDRMIGDKIKVNEAHDALKKLDDRMPNEEIDSIIAYGAKMTVDALTKLPPNHTVPAEEFLARIRTGQLLKRHTPKAGGHSEENQDPNDSDRGPTAGSDADDVEAGLDPANKWGDDLDYTAFDEAELAAAEAATAPTTTTMEQSNVEQSGSPTFIDVGGVAPQNQTASGLTPASTNSRRSSNQSLRRRASSMSNASVTSGDQQQEAPLKSPLEGAVPNNGGGGAAGRESSTATTSGDGL